MTRSFRFHALSGGFLAIAMAATGWAGVFGQVVPIGGNASDIVLDEARGVLYIADFTANRIEVMNTSDLTIPRSLNVNAQPGSMSMSPDGRYLVIGHYGNNATPVPPNNALTVINLGDNTRQIFPLANSPLGVTFGSDGLALILTSAGEFFLFDPTSGTFRLLQTIGSQTPASPTLPVVAGKFPSNVTAASMAASGDGNFIHGLTDAIEFIYDVKSRNLTWYSYTATPPLGPRLVSVNQDGSLAVLGWSVTDYTRFVTYDFPNPSGLLSVGSHVVDSAAGLIYAQIPPPGPPPPPPASTTSCLPDGRCLTITNAPSATASSAGSQPPTLSMVDADNLTIRGQFQLAENLTGRSVLNAAGDTMYSISDSGVTVFPVGSKLSAVHRLAVSREAMVFENTGCANSVASQQITITDPGGGSTDFALTPKAAGILISPSTGVTPATVTISYDPVAFGNQTGTLTIPVWVTSTRGVDIVPTLSASGTIVSQTFNVLINNHGADQRGTVINVPGALKDILSDDGRNRYYILRQDKNQVLVFNAMNNTQIATLRTGNLPTQMAITRDGKNLLVGSDSAQYITVFDLDSLQADPLVAMPFGHYPRSVAVSGKAILAASRVAGPKHMISQVDLAAGQATVLATLGVFANDINIDTVLVGTPNGSSILAAMADGRLMLYDAGADTFTISRPATTAVSGVYAGSSYDQFVVGTTVLDASLAAVGQLGSAPTVVTAGFSFADQIGLRTAGINLAGPGNIERVDLKNLGVSIAPSRMVEAPKFTPAAGTTTTTTTAVSSGISVFSRTLALLSNVGMIVSLSQSGVTVLPAAFDAAVPTPHLTSLVNAADHTQPVASGGLVSVFGAGLSPTSVATTQIPLPSALGDSCLSVNGVTIPLVFVSDAQINAQLPFNIEGSSQIVLHTAGGASNNFNFMILPNAPSVFQSSDLPTVVRAANNAVVSDGNPVVAGDELVIYATGLGRTSPAVATGAAAPSSPLAAAMTQPSVTLSGMPLEVDYAGLTPGGVGVYQINVKVPGGLSPGSSVPLTIQQGGSSTTVSLQVADQ